MFFLFPLRSYHWSVDSTCTATLQHTYLSLLTHTWNSSLICCVPHHGPPHIEKEIHSVFSGGRVGDTAGSYVPPEWTCCRVSLPCAQPLHFSAHYFSEGRERWASSLSSPHSHSCFSQATSRSSLKIPIPACFFSSTSSGRFYFCKDTPPSPVFKCSHSCIMTASGRVCPRQRAAQHHCSAENHRSLFPGKLTGQPNLQQAKKPYLPTLINQVTVSFTSLLHIIIYNVLICSYTKMAKQLYCSFSGYIVAFSIFLAKSSLSCVRNKYRPSPGSLCWALIVNTVL